jgi:DedD protein
MSELLEQQDTEIVLGTGKLLGIFFSLVAICGTFFGLGYTLGRNSSPVTLQNGQAARLPNSAGAKPLAGVTVSTPPATLVSGDAATNPNIAANSQVEQVPPTAAVDEGPSANPQPIPAVRTSPTDTSNNNTATPELAAGTGSITVQVAAVTKQEDAQVLVAALRKKNYPVFVAPTTSNDSLYHVQVGPFAELKDAEEMKSKLAGDGYNAIVKK